MSTQSSLGIDRVPYHRYLVALFSRLGLRITVEDRGASYSLSVKVPLQGVDNHSRMASVVIILTLKQSCWVVERFTVNTANPFLVLQGPDFLEHYGKRPCDKTTDRADPKPSNQFWILNRAADLQAMLVAYDTLAKEFGLPALFGH